MMRAAPRPDVPDLRIHLTKRADGGAVLRCVRDDGSATWQQHAGRQAGFFPTHDLTHLAVEAELSFRRGFFGLIAEGWDIADTTGKGSRGALPAEAITVEHIVGFLDLERASGTRWTAAEFNENLTAAGRSAGLSRGLLTDADLDRVRERRREIFARWQEVPPGGTLELTFDRAEEGER